MGDDPSQVAVTIEACGQDHGRYRWHLTDTNGVSVRISPESYSSFEAAAAVGGSALGSFGAAQE